MLALLGAAMPAAAAAWQPCNAAGVTAPLATRRSVPPYPEPARLSGAEGYVEVALTILRDGSVGWAHVLRAEPRGFFEAASLDGVRSWQFEPAQMDGQAIECQMRTRLKFRLAEGVEPGGAGTPASRAEEPIARREPVYPESARVAGTEGYAEVAFSVLADGRVVDAEVLAAVPRGEFETAALAAVRAWRFATAAAGSVPRRYTRRFDFSLPQYAASRGPVASFLAAAAMPPGTCEQKLSGRVRLEADLGADGTVRAVRVLDARPPGVFDATALAVLRRSQLQTAYRAGVPVAATALATLTFDPDEARCPGADAGSPRTGPRGSPAPRVSSTADEPKPGRDRTVRVAR
jgi:TonB family protein